MSNFLECILCGKSQADMKVSDIKMNPFNCGFCGGALRDPGMPMTTELKHKLYDAYLKGTPIKFESVTEEQFVVMKNVAINSANILRKAYLDFCVSIKAQTKDLFNGR